jgi:hypothetical protein
MICKVKEQTNSDKQAEVYEYCFQSVFPNEAFQKQAADAFVKVLKELDRNEKERKSKL